MGAFAHWKSGAGQCWGQRNLRRVGLSMGFEDLPADADGRPGIVARARVDHVDQSSSDLLIHCLIYPNLKELEANRVRSNLIRVEHHSFPKSGS